MGVSKRRRTAAGAEYLALWTALGGCKSALAERYICAPCMFCGKKKSAIHACEFRDGTVSCACKACGATKEMIYARLGLDIVEFEADRIYKKEMENMAAMDVLGENRCTACEHYLCVEAQRDGKLYGCKIRNLYRMGELFDAGGECGLYRPDRDALMKGLADLESGIAAYRRVIGAYEERRAQLKALLDE